ncbi:hypothetical protein K438DRAFT_1062243 [Mycena galopus ATCC 62051]|nr:hypothetical protein K438DRAFT_1062243 [Mycena galopus ATCC 62051]
MPSSSSFSFFSSANPTGVSRPDSCPKNFPSSSSFSYFSSAKPPATSRRHPASPNRSTSHISCETSLVAPTHLPYSVPEFFDFDLDLIRRQYPLKRKRDDDDQFHRRILPKRSCV